MRFLIPALAAVGLVFGGVAGFVWALSTLFDWLNAGGIVP